MLPFNMGAGGASGAYTGDIPASLRHRRSGSCYSQRTPPTAGNRLVWTYSVWFQRGSLGTPQWLLDAGTDGNNESGIVLEANDTLQIYNYVAASYGKWIITNAVCRDPSSFYHLVVSSNGTTWFKVYLNGVELTSFSTNTGTNGTNWFFNSSSYFMRAGARFNGTGHFDGQIARECFVADSALAASDFGYFNTETNEWVTKTATQVKAIVDAGGANSSMRDFDDATSLTTLGYDKSSKGNNWTLNNFSLTAGASYDRMLDVPGNSYCTLNPLFHGSSSAPVPTNGNLNLSAGGVGVNVVYHGTHGVTSGKWYFEITAGDIATSVGWATGAMVVGSNYTATSSGAFGRSYYGNTGQKYDNGTNSAYGATYTTNDVIGVALDLDAGKLYFSKNGTFQNSGDPIAGTGFAFSGLSGQFLPIFGAADQYTPGSINFGQAPLHASATYHSAAGGYFRYAPPTGYKALCQRNMPDPAILNPENGFVSVAATEDNIYSTLASARSGWTDYVDILKNRAAAESWAWQFSHDSSNEYAVSASSLVRQAKRTQSGSNNWVGYSIRIGATYGTAAGSVSHTNGAATTITHNIGKSARQLILLFNRAGGSAVPVYHPDLTSGELLDLCTTAADAVSTAITSVGTNSFQIGSGVATGTYDYLVCSEISQFFDLGKWTGNAAADGAYYNADHKPKMLYAKSLSTTDDHRVYDDLRPGYNVQGGVVLANTNAAETTAAEMDITAFGMKARIATTPNAAQTYVTASWASVASKYSLAR